MRRASEATLGALVVGHPMAHLLGALDELSLPISHIVVRIPTEKLLRANDTPREAFLSCARAARRLPS